MFEITGEEISRLSDVDLRQLIVRLCEAEIVNAGLPMSAVLAGGHQNAADGGLDVRVRLANDTAITGYIPRANTGFQVKKPDMPASAIDAEMKPSGSVRPVIEELANESGAYIIVSSAVSASDTRLSNRMKAMRSAVASLRNASRLHLDFYDKDRIARWVSCYPGVAAWVREKLGKPLLGWLPYGNWSNSVEPADAEYLLDELSRIRDGRNPIDGDLSIQEGIRRIRDVLAAPKGVVRLIGLSGLGKTRLIQALFDTRIGESALSPSLVVYADQGDAPQPSPRDFIRSLVQAGQRAIVVVDNCKPDTHRALAALCVDASSKISVVTVEYDVGEDEPEDTHVFRLEPASADIIDKLVARRAPLVSQVNRSRIAEFAGGNARVALALARTVDSHDNVSKLTNRELFGRLFHQGRPENDGLLRAAEACALVYSFDGEASGAEIPILASLAGVTTVDLYRYIGDLRARDLLQRRSNWRAILPQALANELARQAWERIAPEQIRETILKSGLDRLVRSFSRRMGLLHDSGAVRRFVGEWLRDGGEYSDIGTLSPLGLEIFQNIAAVAPELTLEVLSRCLTGTSQNVLTDLKHPYRYKCAILLRSLAYEADSFEKAALLLARFVAAEPPQHNQDSVKEVFCGLFRCVLSGTHASVNQRIDVIKSLMGSGDNRKIEIAISALDEMFEAWHFSSSQLFQFGARSRDFGWQPKHVAEVADWFRSVIRSTFNFWDTAPSLRSQLEGLVASNFRALWCRTPIQDELLEAARKFSAHGPWLEGWYGVRQTLRFDKKRLSPEKLSSLQAIEVVLRPRDLASQIRAFVLSESFKSADLVDADEPVEAYEKAGEQARELGEAISDDTSILETLLPELLAVGAFGQRCLFGVGLADGSMDLVATWRLLVDRFGSISDDKRNADVLRGFLSGTQKKAPIRAAEFLEGSVSDPVLAPWFPALQFSVPLDSEGADRLLRSLQLGRAPVRRYGQYYFHPLKALCSIEKYIQIQEHLSTSPDGVRVAIDNLHMSLYLYKDSEVVVPDDLLECGRSLLTQISFERYRSDLDHALGEIVGVCLQGVESRARAVQVCAHLVSAFSNHSASVFDCGSFLESLFKVQPEAALDAFFSDTQDEYSRSAIFEYRISRANPLHSVPFDDLMAWANISPINRFRSLADSIDLFVGEDGDGDQSVTELALKLLDHCPDKASVLTLFEHRLMPMQWSGSRASIIDKRRAGLCALLKHLDPSVVEWAKKCDDLLRMWADQERKTERVKDEGFE